MNATEINNMIRWHIGEQQARMVGADLLTQTQAEAINLLGQLLFAAEPEYWEKMKSVSSYTNVFSLPSDLITLQAVWDMDTTAGDISGAADNGSGLVRVTETAHGYTDGAIVTIHDIVGTTEANGTWQIDYVDENTYDLVGSTFSSAYSSGGKSYEEKEDLYKYPIARRPSGGMEANDETVYIHRGGTVVVDDPDFANDILVSYRYMPSALSEIPTRMHEGIWGYGVVKLIHIPATDKPEYPNAKKNYELGLSMWEGAQRLARAFMPNAESSNVEKSRRTPKWL